MNNANHEPVLPRVWTTAPPRGMGPYYHFIRGLQKKDVLLCCTEEEAHLIAAAPELLAALQLTVAHWSSQFERRGHAAPDWCKQARAAITKATEGQP